jgi:hypothetical protein
MKGHRKGNGKKVSAATRRAREVRKITIRTKESISQILQQVRSGVYA